ncbi:Phosphopantothenoylcysteine synthetase [Streptococcus sp. DD10]|nr:Phosphopantothenoylcysteine synthetase [Streptococcus sp. DD10]
MKILVTSGGTSESIDKVRSITNHSTGQLGKIITESLLKAGHEVCLVTTKRAVKPDLHEKLVIHEITNTADLYEKLKSLVPDYRVLIHSMAVSDYTPVYMTGFNQLLESRDFTELLKQKNTENKISSKDEFQVLFLKKTPKIISLVKDWNPNIYLVGFKLLVDVEKEHLLNIARENLKKIKQTLLLQMT